jgi:hypothetical protein
MKKIVFLPIDIDLTELKFQQIKTATKSPAWQGDSWWDSSVVTEEGVKENGFDKILNQLPLTKITRFLHKVQQKKADSHLDCQPKGMLYEDGEYEYLKSIEPSGYRIVLSGNPKALWVHNNKEWCNVTLPNVPCCYIINATAGFHKLDLDFGRETIYLRGYVDLEKHHTLLNRSLEKYKDYAVYFQ